MVRVWLFLCRTCAATNIDWPTPLAARPCTHILQLHTLLQASLFVAGQLSDVPYYMRNQTAHDYSVELLVDPSKTAPPHPADTAQDTQSKCSTTSTKATQDKDMPELVVVERDTSVGGDNTLDIQAEVDATAIEGATVANRHIPKQPSTAAKQPKGGGRVTIRQVQRPVVDDKLFAEPALHGSRRLRQARNRTPLPATGASKAATGSPATRFNSHRVRTSSDASHVSRGSIQTRATPVVGCDPLLFKAKVTRRRRPAARQGTTKPPTATQQTPLAAPTVEVSRNSAPGTNTASVVQHQAARPPQQPEQDTLTQTTQGSGPTTLESPALPHLHITTPPIHSTSVPSYAGGGSGDVPAVDKQKVEEASESESAAVRVVAPEHSSSTRQTETCGSEASDSAACGDMDKRGVRGVTFADSDSVVEVSGGGNGGSSRFAVGTKDTLAPSKGTSASDAAPQPDRVVVWGREDGVWGGLDSDDSEAETEGQDSSTEEEEDWDELMKQVMKPTLSTYGTLWDLLSDWCTKSTRLVCRAFTGGITAIASGEGDYGETPEGDVARQALLIQRLTRPLRHLQDEGVKIEPTWAKAAVLSVAQTLSVRGALPGLTTQQWAGLTVVLLAATSAQPGAGEGDTQWAKAAASVHLTGVELVSLVSLVLAGPCESTDGTVMRTVSHALGLSDEVDLTAAQPESRKAFHEAEGVDRERFILERLRMAEMARSVQGLGLEGSGEGVEEVKKE